MTGTIIPPSYFYLLSVCDTLSQVASAITVVSVIALAILVFFRIILPSISWDEDEVNAVERHLLPAIRTLSWVLPVSLLLAVFVPSKTMLLSMMVAKFATYENAELTVDAIKEAVDYIVAAIASLK